MSELAFDQHGAPFKVPANAAQWKVKRISRTSATGAGRPEVIHGDKLVRLALPIDATADDVRAAVRNEPGRYHLVAIDDEGEVIPNTPIAVVVIHDEGMRNEAPPAASVRATAAVAVTSEHAVVMEAMRSNESMARSHADVSRTIAEYFGPVAHAMAGLVQAAHGAGLTTRLPYGRDDEDDDADDETPPAAPAAAPSALESIIAALAPVIAPAVASAIASGKLSIPGGLGALFDCRRAVPRPANDNETARASTRAANDNAPKARAAAPTQALDPQTLAHVAAVYAQLTPEEGQLAQGLAAELSATERAAWLAELSTLSVDAAVAKLRTLLGTVAAPTPAEGAS